MIQATTRSAIAILEHLVAFDTTSRDSNLALIAWVEDYLKGHGIQATRIPSEDGNKANLWATIGHGNGGMVLSGHTDVVPVDGQEWHTPPFTLTQREDKLYGRGASDMKGFIACVLALVPHWKQSPPAMPVHIALSYDEEIGCIGVPHLLSFVRSQHISPALAIIGEPTEMKMVVGHKGIASYETTFTGLEGHSSDPDRGVNAIEYASRFITFLNTLQQDCKQHMCQEFHPPYTTVHVGVIRGGTARNIIPKQCYVNWEIRPTSENELLALESKVSQHLTTLQGEMKSRHPQAGVQQQIISRNPVLVPEPSLPMQSQLMTALATNQTETISFYTEGGLFQKAGIPSVIIGPGSIKQAHAPNEFIEVSQLDACIHFLENLLS